MAQIIQNLGRMPQIIQNLGRMPQITQNLGRIAEIIQNYDNSALLNNLNVIISDNNLTETQQCLQIQQLFETYPLLNINAKDYEHFLPIHLACMKGKTQIVELLINYNADLNSPCLELDSAGSPLFYALYSGDSELPKILLNRGAKPDRETLCFAARYNIKMVLPLIVDYGVDPLASTSHNDSVLYELINANFNGANDSCPITLNTVQLLIEKGVDVNAGKLMSCLSLAAQNKCVNICGMLLDAGARVDQATLERAIGGGNENIVRMILAKGNFDTTNLIAKLVEKGAGPNLVDLLVEYGATVDVLDKTTSVPNAAMIKHLLELGANREKGSLLKRRDTPEVKDLLENYHPVPSLSQLIINTLFKNPELAKKAQEDERVEHLRSYFPKNNS